jgi:hypothetical protein
VHCWKNRLLVAESNVNLESLAVDLSADLFQYSHFIVSVVQIYHTHHMRLSNADDLLCLQLHTVLSPYTVHTFNSCCTLQYNCSTVRAHCKLQYMFPATWTLPGMFWILKLLLCVIMRDVTLKTLGLSSTTFVDLDFGTFLGLEVKQIYLACPPQWIWSTLKQVCGWQPPVPETPCTVIWWGALCKPSFVLYMFRKLLSAAWSDLLAQLRHVVRCTTSEWSGVHFGGSWADPL